MSRSSSREWTRALHGHGQVAGHGLAFDRHAINHSVRQGLFTNRIFRHLRHRQRHLPGKQRFGGVNLNGRQVQVRRAEAQGEAGFAGILVDARRW